MHAIIIGQFVFDDLGKLAIHACGFRHNRVFATTLLFASRQARIAREVAEFVVWN